MTYINIYAHALLLIDNVLKTILVHEVTLNSKNRRPTEVLGHQQGVLPTPLQASDQILVHQLSLCPVRGFSPRLAKSSVKSGIG